MITKIKLKNWKSHSDSELTFEAGTNGLVGIVGSGKTSILDAICFALFGTFPTLQTRKIKLDDIIMKKPVEKNSAEVEVSFQLNSNNYSVKRIIEKQRGTSYSEIRENGNLLESPSTKSVTTRIEQIMKVNYELFSKAIYSEQNSIDYFLTLGKGQRMKKIDELLMIDRFEKSRANAVKLKNKIIDVKLGRQSTIEQLNPVEIIKSIEDLKKSIDELEQNKSKLKGELEEFTKKKTNLEKEVVELRKIKENFEELRRSKSAIDSAFKETSEIVVSLEKSLEDIKSGDADFQSISDKLEEHSEKINEMNNFLSGKQSAYESLQSQISESKAKIEFLGKEKISKLEADVEEKLRLRSEFEHLRDTTGENLEEQLDEKRKILEKLIGELETAKSKVKELEEILNKLSSVEGRCPICGSALSEERKSILLTEKHQELNALKQKIKDTTDKKQLNEQDIENLQSAAKKLGEMLLQIKDFDRIKTDLENSKQIFLQHSQSVETLSEELGSLRTEIEIVQKEMATTVENKQKLELLSAQMRDYESRKSRLQQLETKKEELDKHVTQLEEQLGERETEKVENWLRNIIAKEKEAETKIANFDSLTNERMERVREYEKILEASQREREEVERLGVLIKELKIFTQALQQTQIELRKEFIEAVNHTMNTLWPTLYPYQDFIGIRLTIEEGDYVLQLQERGMAWINVEGTASGGERSIACLALRIAFALILAPHLRMLVLDEPTANLDANSVKVLATTLRESINEFVDQCFIITHDEALEESVTGKAYRLERDKGKDEATKVIQIN
jgi:exonuclease SbcC